jgi:hypothetical protein
VPDRAAVPAALQAEADSLARMIRRSPWDWHALQPVWPADQPVPTAGRVAG